MDTKRHRGAYDRGSADSYYRRRPEPHLYAGDTFSKDGSRVFGERILEADMTPAEIYQYWEGYKYNEQLGHHKDWR